MVLGFPHLTNGHLESGLVGRLAGSVQGDVGDLPRLGHDEDLHWLGHLLSCHSNIVKSLSCGLMLYYQNQRNLSAGEHSGVHERPAL